MFRAVFKRGLAVFISCAVLLEINHWMMLYVGNFFDPEWGPKVADFVAGIVASGTYILIVPLYARDVLANNSQTHFWNHAIKHVHQLAIEMLRVAAKVVIGLVLLIIPGIIWSVQYTFVPLIVQFDQAYLDGKVDALRQSAGLVKGRFWAIFLLSLVFLGSSICETYKYVFSYDHPLFYVLVIANLIIEVYVYTLLFSVYERLVKRT